MKTRHQIRLHFPKNCGEPTDVTGRQKHAKGFFTEDRWPRFRELVGNYFMGLIDVLTLSKRKTTISEEDVYTDIGLEFREKLIADICQQVHPTYALDLGAGNHTFVLSQYSRMVIAINHNIRTVDRLNRRVRREHKTNIVPVCMDVSQWLPNGYECSEIDDNVCLLRYFKFQLACGFALIHHLCIGVGLSMERVASLFHALADYVVVEFVPPDDVKVRQLTKNGRQVPSDYSLKHCIDAFKKYYASHSIFQIPDSDRRILYFLRHGHQG